MTALRIRHRTTYAYRRRVSLGPHRLMLRPRESRDLRLISSEIKVTPARRLDLGPGCLRQRVATVTFSARTDVLAIDAAAELELHASAWPVFRPGQRRLGLGHPYQRRGDDRTAHAGARSPLEKLLLRRLEVGSKRIRSQRRGKGGRRAGDRPLAWRPHNESSRNLIERMYCRPKDWRGYKLRRSCRRRCRRHQADLIESGARWRSACA